MTIHACIRRPKPGEDPLPDCGKVYLLLEPDTWEVRYVGICFITTFAQRLDDHLSDGRSALRRGIRREDTHKTKWIAAHLLADPDWQPEMIGLCTTPFHDLKRRERECIAFYRVQGADLVNGTDGGDGTLGHTHNEVTREKFRIAWIVRRARGVPEETRRRQSEAQKRSYERNPSRREISRQQGLKHKGKVNSEEQKRKNSEAQKRLWEDPEYRERQNAALDASGRSETLAKLNRSRRGQPLSEEHLAKMHEIWQTPEYRAKQSTSHQRPLSPVARASFQEKYASHERCGDEHDGVLCRKIKGHSGLHKNWGRGRPTVEWSGE